MDNSFKKNGVYLSLFFGLTLLVCFLVEIFLFVLEAIKNCKSSQTLVATAWILLSLTALNFVLKKGGINPKSFAAPCIIFGPFVFAAGILFNSAVGTHKTYIIERNYVGTSGTTEEMNNEGDGTITKYHNTYVFHIRDRALTHEEDRLEEEFDEGSSKEEFIFWQTALVKGFEPKNISGYHCCDDFSQRLELYLTVGPLTIAECLIKATAPAFVLLIIPLVGLLFKRRLFFDDLDDLRRVYKTKSNDSKHDKNSS